MTKEDIIKKLRSDPMYRLAMASVKDDAAKLMISRTAEAFVSSFFDAMVPILSSSMKKEDDDGQ